MTDIYDTHIESVLNVLEDGNASNKLIESVKTHQSEFFAYLTQEYQPEFTDEEFGYLEYGAFLICAVLQKHDESVMISVDDFIDKEESYSSAVEEDKTAIKKAFTKISLQDPKLGLYDLTEEYYFTLEEEKLSPLLRNLIAIVMLSLNDII